MRRSLSMRCWRREFLRTGGGLAIAGFAPFGSSAGQQVTGEAAAGPSGGAARIRSGRARSCILVYLLGGPSHLDTFDLKPGASAEVRGPFSPVSTNVPGITVCEHLPQLAAMADKYALIRSVSHRNDNHTPMIYYTLTGRHTAQPEVDNDVRHPLRSDFPHVGSVLSHLLPSPGMLPGYVAIPEVAIRSSLEGEFKRARTPLRGGNAGFLGAQFDPLAVSGEPGTPGAVPALALPEGLGGERFERRTELLSLLERRGTPGRAAGQYAELRDRAVVLTGAAGAGSLELFALESEPAPLQERYGRHRFGKALLLARRLAEAGVPMVAVHFNEMTVCDGWDTHSKNFEALEKELLPMLDQGLSALLGDLEERGRLEETLVVCLGEFGRTPKINANAGRDHWGACSSALLAGGGIRGGQVLGASDRIAAWPVADRVDPVDIHATLYHCMGLDPHARIYDRSRQPWEISTGRVLESLL